MGFFSWLFGGPTSGSSESSDKGGYLKGPGNFAFPIVGESNYQDALEEICGGRTEKGFNKTVYTFLHHEDDNPYDNMAIQVLIDGKTVGYLNREHARQYRKKLVDAGHPNMFMGCSAMIRGGWDRGGGDKGYFGVVLDLPTGDE